MKILISEKQLGDIKQNLILPKFIYKAIKDNTTSLGDCPCLPKSDDFLYKILKNREKQVYDNISLFPQSLDSNDLKKHLSVLMKQCIELEKPIREQLEKYCFNTVVSLFSIPDGFVDIQCKLKDSIDLGNTLIIPEDEEYSFDDVSHKERINKEILKRRFIDALIQGAAFQYSVADDNDTDKDFFEFLNKGGFLNLYSQIVTINNFLTFKEKEKISATNQMLCSNVSVLIGDTDNQTVISSEGLIFPYLLKETIRGIMELLSVHGLPENNAEAEFVIRQSDFLVAEAWDMRLGIGLWDKIFGNKCPTEQLPYVFSKYCSTNADDFFKYNQEILSGTKKGEKLIRNLISKSKKLYDYNSFLTRISQKQTNYSMLNDSYMSADEL